jgi:hypothetical protein
MIVKIVYFRAIIIQIHLMMNNSLPCWAQFTEPGHSSHGHLSSNVNTSPEIKTLNNVLTMSVFSLVGPFSIAVPPPPPPSQCLYNVHIISWMCKLTKMIHVVTNSTQTIILAFSWVAESCTSLTR